jgi:hypothetical protein
MSDPCLPQQREATTAIALFASVPGLDWSALPPTVRDSHRVPGRRVLRGEGQIQRGRGVLARALAAAFGFPLSASCVPVEVVKTAAGEQELWRRRFGDHEFCSRLKLRGAYMTERFGPFVFELGLAVRDAGLEYPVRRAWLLGLPLPRWLLPTSETREFERDGCFHFDVSLDAPLGIGRVVRYRGWLRPDDQD